MKNLANILRKADITPRERILTLVRNDVEKDKNGKGILAESEIYSLTQGWKPKNSHEVNEYNKYLNLSKLETTMRLDAQMFACRSENILLRSHVLIEHTKNYSEKTDDYFLFKYVSKNDAIDFAVKNTYLDYTTLLHALTFNNLPKDIQNDLAMLDEYVAHDKKYLEDEVFLFELFKDSKKLTPENKYILIDRIYSCIYHDGFRKLKNGTEKEGFLTSHFFAELPMDAVIKKWAEYAHISVDGKDSEALLNDLEQYAKDRSKTMEMVTRETLSRWIDEGLFTKEYIPMFFSDDHMTWRGDTKLTHKEIFDRWYEELEKTKAHIDKLVSDESLVVEEFDKNLLGITERVQIITGESLYWCEVDIDFVKEFKEKISILLPLAGIYLFIEKYNKPLNNLETLRCFHEISKTFSDLLDVDMTERYSEFLKSFEGEIKLINHSMAMSLDSMSSFLYTKTNDRKYHLDIKENGFVFDSKSTSEKTADDIVERYKKEIEKTF